MPGVSSWVIDAKVMPTSWRQARSLDEMNLFTSKEQVVALARIL